MNTARRSVPRPHPAPRPWWLAFLALIVPAYSAYAPNHDADNPMYREKPAAAPEREENASKESQVLLPPFPGAESLLPLRYQETGTDYRYYMDVTSISREADDVIRFTVVIQAPSGSSNILYEGLRCATDEIKTYAYGTRGGQFARVADLKWTYVHSDTGALGYRAMLANYYICDANGWARDTDSVLEELVRLDPRRGRWEPKPDDAGR